MNSYSAISFSQARRYNRLSLVGQLMAITHFVQRRTMDELTASQNYQSLSLTYVGYITLLAERSYSPGELANKLGISKQACSKTIGELEKAGFLKRQKNPDDSRSSILSLDSKGVQLVSDGMQCTLTIQQQFADKVGSQQLEHLVHSLEQLCRGFHLHIPSYQSLQIVLGKPLQGDPVRLNLLLPNLSSFFYDSMIATLAEKGFEGLKPNFSQVLSLIDSDGGRIQQIAATVGVSKQAIAMIALELEQLGYISKEPDPTDKRQLILQLSARGKQLMSESIAGVDALEARIKDILGAQQFHQLEEVINTLCLEVAMDNDSAGVPAAKLLQLSQNLLLELGPNGARQLAKQLLNLTEST